MDSLAKLKQVDSFSLKNRAAVRLNSVTPNRAERLHPADASLYEMVPEKAWIQPVSDIEIYRIRPVRHRS